MNERQCCICGKSLYTVKFLFCKPCYEEWYKNHTGEPWLRYLMAQEQQRSRFQKNANNDTSLEDLELYA
jgi:hypothetical protein